MKAPENPPAAQEVLAVRRFVLVMKFVELPGIFQIAFDLFFQRLQHSWYRYQHRYSLTAQSVNDVTRLESRLKKNRSAQ